LAGLWDGKGFKKNLLVNIIMEKTKISSRGGARKGAGRPKGSTAKITAQDLIEAANRQLGKPFVESLMEGYVKSIDENNNKVRIMYEKMIIDKVIADRQSVEVTDSADAVAAKSAAFAAALSTLQKRGTSSDNI
jgi:hypothetical protein